MQGPMLTYSSRSEAKTVSCFVRELSCNRRQLDRHHIIGDTTHTSRQHLCRLVSTIALGPSLAAASTPSRSYKYLAQILQTQTILDTCIHNGFMNSFLVVSRWCLRQTKSWCRQINRKQQSKFWIEVLNQALKPSVFARGMLLSRVHFLGLVSSFKSTHAIHQLDNLILPGSTKLAFMSDSSSQQAFSNLPQLAEIHLQQLFLQGCKEYFQLIPCSVTRCESEVKALFEDYCAGLYRRMTKFNLLFRLPISSDKVQIHACTIVSSSWFTSHIRSLSNSMRLDLSLVEEATGVLPRYSDIIENQGNFDIRFAIYHLFGRALRHNVLHLRSFFVSQLRPELSLAHLVTDDFDPKHPMTRDSVSMNG